MSNLYFLLKLCLSDNLMKKVDNKYFLFYNKSVNDEKEE